MTIGFRKGNAEQAADRLYRFYSRQLGDEILATLTFPTVEEENDPPLVEARPDDGAVIERDSMALNDLPLLLEMYQRRARYAHHNPDDSLVTIIPVVEMEGAIETLMLGGKARYWGTRLHTWSDPAEPLIKDYGQFNWRLPEERNVWFQRYLECYRFMARQAGNDFALAFTAEYDGMNLAVQLRGAEQAYLDMYDQPEYLERLLDYALNLHVYLYGRVEEIVGAHNKALYADHPLAQYRVDVQPNKSVDAYSLCRPGTLRRWGMAQMARFIESVGGANLHIHQNGRHVIEEVTEIAGWREVRFTDGPGWPRTFDMRWELRRRMKDIPIVIRCTEGEFLAGIEQRDLPGNARYVLSTDGLDQARRIMDRVHAYRAPCAG